MFASYNPGFGAGNKRTCIIPYFGSPYISRLSQESKKVGTAYTASLIMSMSFVTTAGLRRIGIIQGFLYPKRAFGRT